jgi:hypothetical protein
MSALVAGASLGLQSNPLFGLGGAVLAALLAGHRRASRTHTRLAAAVLLVAWLAGDGLTQLARVRDALEGIGAFAAGRSGWAALAVWAGLSFAVGYLAPALVGIAVGRRVTHGTGRLSAAAVAAVASLALSGTVAGLS